MWSVEWGCIVFPNLLIFQLNQLLKVSIGISIYSYQYQLFWSDSFYESEKTNDVERLKRNEWKAVKETIRFLLFAGNLNFLTEA